MAEKAVPDQEKVSYDLPEKKDHFLDTDVDLQEEYENSPVEAVRLAVPLTDDPTLQTVTFRFWFLSFLFTALGATVTQYYLFRSTTATYSIFFVNLVTYTMGKAMARYLPTAKVTIFGRDFSLNPGPFNIKEHALIGIAVSTGSSAAYATDILAATDIFLKFRVDAFGSIMLIITTQCVGYGMAGLLRKYLVYPAEMVWWSNLVQVVFYNTMHNTDEYKTVRLVRGWSRMKFFWIVATCTFFYQLLPQWIAPIVNYFDWICWFNPFDMDWWAIFGSIYGGGVGNISFDWTSIGGSTMYYPLAAQLCYYGGMILNYWIILPIMWINNILGTKTNGRPLTSKLFFEDGKEFKINAYLNPDYSLNEDKYNAGPQANMAPLYALGFMMNFVSLAACFAHIFFYHRHTLISAWKSATGEEDIHTKMMKIYPEVPHSWYLAFYVVMAGVSMFVCETYGTQLPWWGLLLALFVGFILALPIGVMQAVTGYAPGLNVITELIIGYILPGKPIANMTFKCYGYMAMYQCHVLLGDLKLGHYMKIPPRSLFYAQVWGSIIGALFNFVTMTLIINSQRGAFDGTKPDRNGLWTAQKIQTYWGSGLIYGALGPARMFSFTGKYWFVYIGFIIGFVATAITYLLSKKFPKFPWSKIYFSTIAQGMSAFPNGYTFGVLSSITVAVFFQFFIARYHKGWWKRYVFILSAALDTGAAFTGLMMFLFLGGGIDPNIAVNIPSWWGNYYNTSEEARGPNDPYTYVNRCGAVNGTWTSGMLA
ncbi:hypothetical protein BGX27_004021 [Mortierella sp. AM989]|nr:hypothetical protein BGX27_004021 [Mortierella sp. AM989]